MPLTFTIEPITNHNFEIYSCLVQGYECEFSAITQKTPLPDGTFPLDTHLCETVSGYLAYLGETPCGFNLVKHHPDRYEICEFFVVPVYRRQGVGYRLMESICDQYRGRWEVKQIEGADGARAFWRRAVQRYTGDNFCEDEFDDPYWGMVTRQTFDS